jgi:hypothetical protein
MRLCLRPMAAAASLLSLAACASNTTEYPSLARRDVERAAASPAPAPAPSESPPAADPALAETLPRAIAAARAAQQRFTDAQGGAERAVAAGAGTQPGSESWAVASIALAGLETARSEAMIALADLDALYAEARVKGAGGQDQIIAARTTVSAIIGEQDQVIAALHGRLGR